MLRNGAKVNRATKDGTPLYAACKNGHVAVARLLIDKGAAVDWATKDGATPLYVACAYGHVGAARLVLEKGAETERAMEDGATPLYIACQEGHVGAALLLLDKGADVHKASKSNRTPLHEASYNGHIDVVRLLLANGADADLDVKDESGDTPVADAKSQGHKAVVKLLKKPRPLPLGPPRPQRQQSDVQCSICLGPYIERAWTKCNHSFCRKCIMQVCLTNYPTNRAPCPFCRRPVLLGELTRLETTPMLANEAAQPVRDPQPESGVDAALGDAFTSQGRTNTISS